MVIGVTGGVGSGKTAFSKKLGHLGTRVVEVDQVAKKLIRQDTDIQTSLRRTFGYSIFDESGRLRRRELARIVFSDLNKLESLNHIIHSPLMNKLKTEILLQQRKKADTPLVFDMAILFETQFEVFCDLIIMVVAPLEKRVDWLLKNRGWSIEEIFSRIHVQQKGAQQNREKADVIIENRGTLSQLNRKATEFYKKYV